MPDFWKGFMRREENILLDSFCLSQYNRIFKDEVQVPVFHIREAMWMLCNVSNISLDQLPVFMYS